MARVVTTIGVLAAAGTLFWFYPLFHIVPRQTLRDEERQKTFNASQYTQEFWTTKLIPAFGHAADAATVLTELRTNPDQIREKFGRSLGLSRSSLYFLRGSGTIVSVDDNSIGVSLRGTAKPADIVTVTGLVFGNTVRDATGLIDGSDFPNSQQFNEISTELNRLVETAVIPTVKAQAKVGDTVDFVGCAEVTSTPRDISPLRIVPLQWKRATTP